MPAPRRVRLAGLLASLLSCLYWLSAPTLAATASDGAVPGQAVPGQAVPGKAVPGATASGMPVPDEPHAPRSGYAYLGEELRALQDDAFANPGQLWVDRGRVLWDAAPKGSASCADCHDAPESLAGVAARMPRWDANSSSLENLEMQINQCRTERQYRTPWPWESEPLLAMTTLLASVSRGLPLDVDASGPAAAALAAGEREYRRRRGRLDLSCQHCHEANAGRRLRGDVISDGMINGFPIYRLTWQSLGSRHRMFRWCNEAVEAEPHAFGADEYLALELYLAVRGHGLLIEAPAVRR